MFTKRKKKEEETAPEVHPQNPQLPSGPGTAEEEETQDREEKPDPSADTATEPTEAESEAETEDNDDEDLQKKFEQWLEGREVDVTVKEDLQNAVNLLDNAIRGKNADEALFEILLKGADYQRAVAAAAEAGEVKGRNASIDELITDHFSDDGVPHPQGNAPVGYNRNPSIFDLARECF